MSKYLARRKALEHDPAALEKFLEERRQNIRVARQKERERMEVDPAFAEEIRRKRRESSQRALAKNPEYHKDYRKRKLLEDPEFDRKKNAAKKRVESTPEIRAYNAARQRAFRARNPERTRAAQLAHPQHEKREALRERKAASGCLHCGETDGLCLDFHHVDRANKSFSIASSVNLYSLEELMAEADKCVVLCSNCHRKEHNRRKAGD